MFSKAQRCHTCHPLLVRSLRNSSTCFVEIVYFEGWGGRKKGERDVFYCELQLGSAKYCRQWHQITSLTVTPM